MTTSGSKAELAGTQIRVTCSTQVDGITYKIKVPNARVNVDIGDYVQVASKAKWILTTDIQGNKPITSNMATAAVGDNTYYVLVMGASGEKKMYTLHIRRRPFCSVTFNPNGGTHVNGCIVEEDSIIKPPPAPTKEGFKFIGWNRNFKEPIAADTIINAQWQVINYTITYNLDGGVNGNNPATYTIESETIHLKDATGGERPFGGWFTESTFKNKVTRINHGSQGNVKLFAKFFKSYKITYNLNGGTGAANPDTYTPVSDFSFAEPKKNGYAFTGWYLEPTFEHRIEGIKSGTHGDMQLHAKWVEIVVPVIDRELLYGEVLKGFSNELQYNETGRKWEAHRAVDLEAEVGEIRFPGVGGVVETVDKNHSTYGTIIAIRINPLFVIRFSGLMNIEVKEGQKIDKGTILGIVGAKAIPFEADAPAHLHIEVFFNGQRVNPMQYMDKQ